MKMMNNNKKDYNVRKALIDVNTAAGKRLSGDVRRSSGGRCASSCNCSYCTRMRRQRQQTDQQLRNKLDSMYKQAEQSRQAQIEWEKTQKLLRLMDRSNK